MSALRLTLVVFAALALGPPRAALGFMAKAPRSRRALHRLSMTSSLDTVDEGVTVGTDAKEPLLSVLRTNGSAAARAQVNELVILLEKVNPTASPATSNLLNGEWDLLYSSGIGPASLLGQAVSALPAFAQSAVDLDNVALTIKREQPRVTAVAAGRVGRVDLRAEVRYQLEAETGVRLLESYEGGMAKALGMNLKLPRTKLKRAIFITYLDTDLLISRDSFGGFDLLTRKEKAFNPETTSVVPSSGEGDDSPGV